MEDLNVKKIVGCLVREFGTSDDGGNLTRREMKLMNVVASLLRSAQVDDVEIDEEDEVYMTKATDEDDWEEDLDSSNPYDGATLTEPCVRYDITHFSLQILLQIFKSPGACQPSRKGCRVLHQAKE